MIEEAAWSGDPVTLTVPPWGGNSYRGLASTVISARSWCTSGADGRPRWRSRRLRLQRRELDEELAARRPQRDQLVAAGQEAGRARGPGMGDCCASSSKIVTSSRR